MARYIGPVCKICRREGVKMFLKGDRCYTKCPIDSKQRSPSQGGGGSGKKKRMNKLTEFGKRLREKQKARHMSGVLEKQFRRYFAQAARTKGNTGESLLRMLETRLDNVVRRLGFAVSLAGARQLVQHGHVLLNGKSVDIPSCAVKPGDRVALGPHLAANTFIKRSLEQSVQRGLPAWLGLEESLAEAVKRPAEGATLEGRTLAGLVKSWPTRQEMSFPVNEQFIVELYSK